ncbi:hypothetical protein EB061_04275 [bacterium]|jgi:hypothetical protein|nr:hypothetical protein [bacterium]
MSLKPWILTNAVAFTLILSPVALAEDAAKTAAPADAKVEKKCDCEKDFECSKCKHKKSKKKCKDCDMNAHQAHHAHHAEKHGEEKPAEEKH